MGNSCKQEQNGSRLKAQKKKEPESHRFQSSHSASVGGGGAGGRRWVGGRGCLGFKGGQWERKWV